MASNINTVDIDATYPVAGQDNDSQGFRDNFSTIKDNFVAAKAEIETLQDNTVKLNEDNDFNGNKIQEADFIKNTEVVYGVGSISNDVNISFNNGHYQTISVTSDTGPSDGVVVTLADWPESGKLGKIRVVCKSSSSGKIIWNTEGSGTIYTDGNSVWDDFIVSSGSDIIVDFWNDGGLTVYAHYVGTFSAS